VDLSVTPIGGARTYVAGFTQGLARSQVSERSAITVLLSEAWAEANPDSVRALGSSGVAVDIAAVAEPGSWKARLLRRRLLQNAVERHQSDVVFVPRDVAPRLSVPYVVLARNRYAWHRYSSYAPVGGIGSAALLRCAARQSARRAAAVLAVSNAFAARLPKTVPVSGVVHHGCSMAPPDRPKAPLLRDQPLIVTMIASVTANKGIEVVIQGVAKASADGRAVSLRVRGNEPDPAHAKYLDGQARASLGSSVLHGPALGDALVGAYRQAHVLAVGSLFEAFCLPLVEGMRSGCVIVAPRGPLVAELCGDVAVTYDEGDPASLAYALHTAATELEDRSRRGIERARIFSWEQTVEKTIRHVREAATP
jgi:glycosyltransferase involved in cell wall biosynthesis